MSKILFSILFLFLIIFASVYADGTGEYDVIKDDSAKIKSKSDIINPGQPISKSYIESLPVINVDHLLEFRFGLLGIELSHSIPEKYTCDSIDISLPLNIRLNREGLKSFALICDDPDAPGGTWVHWVIFNLPARHLTLPENLEKVITPDIGQDSTDIQPIQGINDFGDFGYGGPCPPIGQEHRYFFKLYALDTVLEFEEEEIKNGITKDMLLKAMKGYILSKSVLMGKYKR